MLYLDSLCQRNSGSGFVHLYFALYFFMCSLNGYFDYSSHQTKDVHLLSFGDTESNGFFFLLTASQSIYSHYIMRREIPQGPATINMCRLKICAHILYLIYSVPYMKRPKQIYGVLLQAL